MRAAGAGGAARRARAFCCYQAPSHQRQQLRASTLLQRVVGALLAAVRGLHGRRAQAHGSARGAGSARRVVYRRAGHADTDARAREGLGGQSTHLHWLGQDAVAEATSAAKLASFRSMVELRR